MKHVKPVAALALCGLVFGAYGWGRAQGQGEAQVPKDELTSSERDFSFYSDEPAKAQTAREKLLAFYQKGGASTPYSEAIQQRALASFQERFDTKTTTAGDAAQRRSYEDAMFRLALLQTQQNARIIALLEQQQKGK